jgi:hypothetical protein
LIYGGKGLLGRRGREIGKWEGEGKVGGLLGERRVDMREG